MVQPDRVTEHVHELPVVFTADVLVRDREGRAVAGARILGRVDLADETREAGQQDAGGDEAGAAPGARGGRRRGSAGSRPGAGTVGVGRVGRGLRGLASLPAGARVALSHQDPHDSGAGASR